MNELTNINLQTQFIQKKIIEILIDFLLFCEDNKINYGLCGGTLLGAVRHKGFIPWDDDLDLYVSRRDAIKIIEKWKSDKFSLISFRDEKYNKKHTHIKIHDDNYRLIERGDEDCGLPELTNYGIFIDIFIYDEYKNNLIERLIQRHYGKLLFVKQLSNNPKYKKSILMQLVVCIPDQLLKWVTRKIFKIYESRNNGSHIGFGYDTHCNNFFLPKKSFMPFVEYEFCGIKVKGPADYDMYLKQRFGDYMALPPHENRFGHVIKIYQLKNQFDK